jgi:hypothetical protein
LTKGILDDLIATPSYFNQLFNCQRICFVSFVCSLTELITSFSSNLSVKKPYGGLNPFRQSFEASERWRNMTGFFCVGMELSPEQLGKWQFWSGPD